MTGWNLQIYFVQKYQPRKVNNYITRPQLFKRWIKLSTEKISIHWIAELVSPIHIYSIVIKIQWIVLSNVWFTTLQAIKLMFSLFLLDENMLGLLENFFTLNTVHLSNFVVCILLCNSRNSMCSHWCNYEIMKDCTCECLWPPVYLGVYCNKTFLENPVGK